MAKSKATSRFRFTVRFSATPMPQAEWEAAEDLLARLVARAIADEHPEWFGKEQN